MESEPSDYKKFDEKTNSPEHPIKKEDSLEPEAPTPQDIENTQNPSNCCSNPESSIKSFNNYPTLSELQNPSVCCSNPENFTAPINAAENFIAPINAMESGPSMYQNPGGVQIPPAQYIKVENPPIIDHTNPPEYQKIEEKKKNDSCNECLEVCIIGCMKSFCTGLCQLFCICLINSLANS